MMESSETNETTAMEQSAEINAEVRQNEPTQPQATDTVAAETAVSEPTESQEVAVKARPHPLPIYTRPRKRWWHEPGR